MSKQILLVSTGAGSMGGMPTGLWLAELAEPYYMFKDIAGYEVTIASPAGGAIPIDKNSLAGDFFTTLAKKFLHDPDAVDALSHSVSLVGLDSTKFDCVYLCGGHGACVDFRGDPIKSLVEKAYAAGKVVAADCHGPIGLVDCKKPDGTPLVAGLDVCAFTNAEEEAAGATEWVTKNTVFMETVFKEQGCVWGGGPDWGVQVKVAGNLVTAQNPGSAEACAEACMKLLGA
ncbi:class I glutamine amidotransferase-like protein [Pelagophyceae sp. CCMP2097]|nr:class I glutamine amidotransferase-like protein [Pelagophyceae sp. CCMP2097]|mmetsp:Transcript_9841/g.33968  ORF Transcript_9841/g.33968 Transcript_9841/m.33968 type:complete len:230 (-) Transcript_9841:62-751(-)